MARRKRQKRGNRTGSLFKRTARGAYIARWTTHDGKRRERSTNTTDLAVAERILAEFVNDESLRRRGLLNPNAERHADEGRKSILAQLDAYMQSCERAGFDDEHRAQSRRRLERLIADADVTRLSDLNADALERHLFNRKRDGQSARTLNSVRQTAVAFVNWCVKTGRAASNPLVVVSKLNEQTDRRRVRRPLTDDELARLLAVAEQHGRKAWYLCAELVGLRRGDLLALEWRGVNFDDGSITIHKGKSGRVDTLPMHPQLAEELASIRGTALPIARVFPQAVTNETRLKDSVRAGLAREEVVTDAKGNPVMVGRPDRPTMRPKTRIITTDDEGREIDLHALRTTLATNLARRASRPR